MNALTDRSPLNVIDMKIRKYSDDFFMVGGKPRSVTMEEVEDAQPLFAEGIEGTSSEVPTVSPKDRTDSIGQFTCEENDGIQEEMKPHDPLSEEEIQTATYQKTFQWKIPDFLRHVKSPSSNPKEAILLSPEFFIPDSKTSVSVKLYPTGEDDDEGMYLSIYFRFTAKDQTKALMRREVTFCVRKQSEYLESDTISYHMSLDCNGKTSSATVGSGCHKCFSLRDLEKRDFLVDGTLYISVTIDEEVRV